MTAHLFRRVEVAFPILDKKLRERILDHLNAYVADSAQSWVLQADGTYQRPSVIEGKPVQLRLMEES